MNQLTERDLQQHVPIAAWLLIAVGGLMVLLGAFVFVLLAGIGMVSGEAEAFAVLGITATAAGGLLALFGLPGIAAGYGLLRRKNWGRIVAIAIAAINLFSFPVGTVLGAYILFVLLQTSAERYFATPSA